MRVRLLQLRSMPQQVRPASESALVVSEARAPSGRLEILRTHPDWIAGVIVAVGFCWRVWLAQATYFNPDEAWHFSLANQESAWLAYKASLTISHPPLLILLLYFWRGLGTSNLILRLPSVVAGSVFCWAFYRWMGLVTGRSAAWAGLILATFLGPMITISAEVRQYALLLMFSAGAAYLLELATLKNSVARMLASSASLCIAMLSHYSAFFIAGTLGLYAIVRMLAHRPPTRVLTAWRAGQVAALAVAAWLYKTHLGRLSSLLNQALLPQQYLAYGYFHMGQDHLLRYLYRGTIGVFRYVFGQTQIGQLAALLFIAGVILLIVGKNSPPAQVNPRAVGFLLLAPFVLNWLAAAEGLYPYGRMRQCIFLAMFALPGVSVCIARIVKDRLLAAVALAASLVVLCHALGTLQDRDAIPLVDQRREHMVDTLQFLRSQVHPGDVILTDKATSYQLRHYLCRQKPMAVEPTPDGVEVFRCEGFQVVSTNPADGALTADRVAAVCHARPGSLAGANAIWVVQGGWASGLGETLRSNSPLFAQLEIHSFGHYLEVLKLPPVLPYIPEQQAR